MHSRGEGKSRMIGASAVLVILPLVWIGFSRRQAPAASQPAVPERVARFSEEIQRRSEVRRGVKRNASEFGQAGNWSAVVKTIDLAAADGNSSAGLNVLRAEAHLRLGNFEAADSNLRRAAAVGLFRGVQGGMSVPQYGAITGQDDDPVPMAVLHVLASDDNAFRRYRNGILDRTDPTDAPPTIARNVAWAVLLAGGKPTDLARASRLAERASAKTTSDPNGTFTATLALARWKEGRTADAIRLLETASRNNAVLPVALLSVIRAATAPGNDTDPVHKRMDTVMQQTFGDLSADRVQAVLLLRERLLRRSGIPVLRSTPPPEHDPVAARSKVSQERP